jgi:DNA-binding transcriptional ArsR family regulator
MRPLLHPSAEDITVEGILHALSDPVRADIFARIATAACAQTCSSVVEGCAQQVPKSTLSQHFKALRDAGLIRSERKGVEMHNIARCEEVNRRFPGLLPAIMEARRLQQRRAGGTKRAGATSPRRS